MDSVDLGKPAGRLTVYLSRWGDFWDALDSVDKDTRAPVDWEHGTVIDLRFYANKSELEAETIWPAVISGNRAEWYIPKAQVIEDVLAPGNTVARLVYTSVDGKELEWEVGVIR